MSEPRREEVDTPLRRAVAHGLAVHHSVFAKLLVTMVLVAVSILALVVAFFWFTVGPNLHHAVSPVLENYAHDLAGRGLGREEAVELRARLNLEVRYEGPEGAWATAEDLPRITDVREGRVPLRNAVLLRRNYFLAEGPQGGSYLFAWSLGRQMNQAHTLLLVLLVSIIAGVVIIGYVMLKRFLGPVRTLNEGVSDLAAGRLDVALKVGTKDEFGRLTEAFNHMVGRVRAMIGARDQLLADVSHELRSPLTRLKVALELLPDGVERSGMEADVAEMEKKVSELLELERLRAGRGLEVKSHDLLQLVRDVVEGFHNQPPGVTLSLPSEPVWLEIDADKVRSVFRNLLENAFKYGARSHPVELSLVCDEDSVTVAVADDGPGISDRDAPRVFEPFFRADPSRAKTTGGYGLGLSICKRVMQAHGGDIILDRSREHGARFVLTFPRAR